MEPHVRIVTVPMLDTGLGREAGYANDRELLEAGEAQRAALPAEVRELVDEVDARFERRVLFGEDA